VGSAGNDVEVQTELHTESRCSSSQLSASALPKVTTRIGIRVVEGVVVCEGEQVVIGDTGGAGPEVRYEVLCSRTTSPAASAPDPIRNA
jgi:hypothetical protein